MVLAEAAHARQRVYRIGWMTSPPFEVAGPDGNAAGIAVDLVNLAARRRGIQLTWVRWPDSSESALRSRAWICGL